MTYVSHFYAAARHPSSLLPFTSHNPALLLLIESRIDSRLIAEVANRFSQAIQVEEEVVSFYAVHHLPSPPYSPEQATISYETAPLLDFGPGFAFEMTRMISLEEFISWVIYASRANVAMLLVTLIYLERLCKATFDSDINIAEAAISMTKGFSDLPFKVFLTAFIVSTKYLNDYPPDNAYFTACAQGLFPLKEVNKLERLLLKGLKFDVGVKKADVERVWKPFIIDWEERLKAQASVPIYFLLTPPPETARCDNAVQTTKARSKRRQTSAKKVVLKTRSSERCRMLNLNKKLGITNLSITAY